MRRALALLAVAGAVLAGVVGAAPADAAPAPHVVVDQPDPLQTNPVELTVAVLGPDGGGVAFSGTATLATGGATVTRTVSGSADAVGLVDLPTTTLRAGWAVLRLRLKVGRSTVVRSYPWFAELDPPLSVSAFGCAAIAPGGGAIRWAVDRMAGDPVRTPNSRDVPLLPYIRSSNRRWVMTDEDGQPLATSGTVVVRSATAKVATIALKRTVRRLVFGAQWTGRVGGAFKPGVYTATLTLAVANGSTVTATQTVEVVARGTGSCGI